MTSNTLTSSSTIEGNKKEFIIIPDLTLPCETRVYGWNIITKRPGNISLLILRDFQQFPNKSCQFQPVFNKSFNAVLGLNIFREDIKTTFLPGDLIALVAARDLVKQSHRKSSVLNSGRYPLRLNETAQLEKYDESKGKFDLLVILKGKTYFEFY